MSTILLVEPNAIGRRRLASALAEGGHTVNEATDGRAALSSIATSRPDVIVLDTQLPDLESTELCRRIQSLDQAAEIPVIALIGFTAQGQLENGWSWFSDYLFKPVEPAALRKVVRSHLARPRPIRHSPIARRRVLVVDDDTLQLKLSAFRLTDATYEVSTAAGGVEALEMARTLRPDAILSDVLMPDMDGYRLCLAIRADPGLANTPVVLASSVFVEEADHELATQVGANALVTRTPDCEQILNALAIGLSEQPPPVAPDAMATTGDRYAERTLRQLERHAGLNAELVRKLAFREVQNGILSAAADVLARSGTLAEVLDQLLRCSVEAAGMSHGAIYILEGDQGIALRAQCGFPTSDPALPSFFRCAHLLYRAIESHHALVLPNPNVADPEARALLARSGLEQILIVPIPGHGGSPGVLCLGSRHYLADLDSRHFAEALAHQMGQSIALTEAFSRAAAAEATYREMFENAAEGIFRLSAEGRILTANPALARMLGYENPQELIAYAGDWAGIAADHLQAQGFLERLGTEGTLSGVEITARRKDDTASLLMVSSRVIRDAGGMIRCYECMAQDITARKRIAQLEMLEKEHRAQLEWKDQLLSHVSHELRSPLATIHQFVSLVHDGVAGPVQPEQRGHLAIALSNMDSLRKMISDLLDVSRVANFKMSIRMRRCWAQAVIDDVMASTEPLAAEKGLQILADVDRTLPALYADPQRMRQVLTNLVENAIKFTPCGGRIWIRARSPAPDAEFLSIMVEDTGCGVGPEDQGRIFEQLCQARAPTEEARRGLGLGLYLCREWVIRQGGDIWVESEPGCGSRFTFTVAMFSVTRLITPICTVDNLESGSLTLVTVEVSPRAPRPLSERDDAAIDAAWESVSSCILPDLDVLLPRLCAAGDRETFVVVCFAKADGAEVLSRRIRAQLGKNMELTRAALGFHVSVRPIPGFQRGTWTTDSVAALVARELSDWTDTRLERRTASWQR